jgi:nicotinamidase-related amidase
MSEKRRIERAHSQLLVVDMQEKLLPTIADAERAGKNVGVLLAASARLDVPQTLTLQNPEKLGQMPDSLCEHLRAPAVFSKMTFSAWREKLVEAHLKHSQRKQIVLVGVEAHVCVMQTALDLLEKGFQVCVPHDAVGSRDPENKRWALQRMDAAGASIVSTESVFFEWLDQAGTPEFRDLRKLIL